MTSPGSLRSKSCNPRHILEPELLRYDLFLTLFKEREDDQSNTTKDWNEYFKLAFLGHRDCKSLVSHWAKILYELPFGVPFMFKDINVSRKDLAGCMIMAHWFLYTSQMNRALALVNRLRQEKNLPVVYLHTGRSADELQKSPELPVQNYIASVPSSVATTCNPQKSNLRKRVREEQDENVFVDETIDCRKKKTRKETIHFDIDETSSETEMEITQVVCEVNSNPEPRLPSKPPIWAQSGQESSETEMEITQVVCEVNSNPKPRLPSKPPIWAQSRQEVCESVWWFRSYHAGVYFSKGIAYGYLLGGYTSKRDVFACDGKLIIGHGGGKRSSVDYKTPTRTLSARDQSAGDYSVSALLRNYREGIPLVLLCDDGYVHFPYDLSADGVVYAVLGWYMITYAWAEKEPADDGSGDVVRWKFAFQWCENQPDQAQPWWMFEQLKTGDTRGSTSQKNAYSRAEQACAACNQKSLQVYSAGWMCLSPSCENFWSLNFSSPLRTGHNLIYDPSFLTLTPLVDFPKEEAPRKIEPELPTSIPTNASTKLLGKGWWCMKCGRLSCRFSLQHWECSHCHEIHKMEPRIWHTRDFSKFKTEPGLSFLTPKIAKNFGIQQKLYRIEEQQLECIAYILPEKCGAIYHIRRSVPIGDSEADNVFTMYQEEAAQGSLQLKRWPMRSHRCRGDLLTSYFSQNSGAPYRYAAKTNATVPFPDENQPSAINAAKKLIEDRISGVFPIKRDYFNEVLTVAYLEEQNMSFHSDAEEGLSQIVASLSLGSKATMHFRPTVLSQDLAKNKTRIILSLQLCHGDVLVMHGKGIQKHYQHTVIPTNFRIAATARRIEMEG